MATPTTEWFLFSSDACPDAGFHVVRFKGTEGLNQFFEFNITVVSTNPKIKLQKLLGDSACFTITGLLGFISRYLSIVEAKIFNNFNYLQKHAIPPKIKKRERWPLDYKKMTPVFYIDYIFRY